MPFSRTFAVALGLAAGSALACGPSFRVSQFPTTESLFDAGVRQLNIRKYDNAVLVFEKLTLELPARDTLLPLSHFYLAKAHGGRGEHLLAAQAYNRLAESFATDTLADVALYFAGRELQSMWRSPLLDSQYGSEAAATYQQLLGLYPDSRYRDSVNHQLTVLQEWFATKDYEGAAMHYFRRKAYDSAIIYLRDVIARYPETARARDSYIRLAMAYEAIRYKDDKADVCNTLRTKYPADREVATVCGPVTAARATLARPDTL